MVFQHHCRSSWGKVCNGGKVCNIKPALDFLGGGVVTDRQNHCACLSASIKYTECAFNLCNDASLVIKCITLLEPIPKIEKRTVMYMYVSRKTIELHATTDI